jgi:hypothetical protein
MPHEEEIHARLDLAKQFSRSGFWVFPLGVSGRGPLIKPYGWAKNAVIDPSKVDKVIAATRDEGEIDLWPVLLKSKYDCMLGGFGVLGEGCVILDIDVKNNKPGFLEFDRLLKDFDVPPPTMMTVTKSGGLHAFYRRPEKFEKSYVKSMVSVVVDGKKYFSVDLRGNGGFVVGPDRLINSLNQWKNGIYATKGFVPVAELPLFPDKVLIQWTKSTMDKDLDGIISVAEEKKEDFRSKIRRGEVPDFIPKGARNESFFVFINVLKGKGVPIEVARQMCTLLAKSVEEPDSFEDSVDVESMIQRVYVMQANSPYDVAIDLINKGLFQLSNYKSAIHYVIMEENPYIISKNAHDERSMKTLLAKFQKNVTLEGGKSKLVNPLDVVIRVMHDENRVDSFGFKPNAGQVFSAHDDVGSKRYLNTFRPIPRPHKSEDRIDVVWKEFQFLVTRIFGYEGTAEYQLAMDFVAWLLQKPHIKPSISPFVTSLNRGVGKSLFFNVLIQILGINKRGERQARVAKVDEITGRFFDPTGCIVNLIDEVQFPVHRDSRKESVTFWRHLKNLITAETVSVEIKGGATHQLPNSAALMLAGNSGSYFPIEDFDRRLWIIDNNPPLLEKGAVDRLFSLVNGSAIEVDERRKYVSTLRYYLYEHVIKTDLAVIRAPMNDIKREMMLNSLTNMEEWFLVYFDNKDNMLAYNDIISISALMYVVETEAPYGKWQEDPTSVVREMKRRGYIKPIRRQTVASMSRQFILNVVGPDGKIRGQEKGMLYTTREHGKYDNMDSKDIVHLYNQNLHTIQAHREKAKAAFRMMDKYVQEAKEEVKEN